MLLVLALLLHSNCWALDVTLQWDANTEPDIAGYDVYYGDHAIYGGTGAAEGDSPILTSPESDENPDPALVEFTLHLPDCINFYYAVKARDDQGRVSDFSNEVFTLSGTAEYFGFEEMP